MLTLQDFRRSVRFGTYPQCTIAMDYQNRAGSKKGSGGIASESQQNIHRRKQVEELLRDGEEVPYTFQGDAIEVTEDELKLKRNPYIYKNHSGKLVCKLCNTMHMSWSSVERHLAGKKHGLNLLRRGGSASSGGAGNISKQDKEFRMKVEEARQRIKRNGVIPKCQIVKVRHLETNDIGMAIRVDYSVEGVIVTDEDELPFLRVISGLELPGTDNDDKKYLMVAFEPFENIAIEMPNKEIIMNNATAGLKKSVDELNTRCGFWDRDDRAFYAQIFFKTS
ncbi:spliceosome assembly protein PRP11 Ecym_5283 [Eremothecium cymbalariae DBVPG|uniref:U1-type domain-containing protein n=1 Tax=Eremothecium cymbalariae (strain CBS 270.75 / DBVPG 7215 / KCTC 17166 / NRRL Y-17582) TaxID=931890 RepID=I6NDA3_ERECY|nr:hypothetical protein Ecym_5283 [Eremothecium cymbalariae DBVPG\